MHTGNPQILTIRLSLPVILAFWLTAGFEPLWGADQTAGAYYRQAQDRVNEGDTTGAIQLLDRALEVDSKHGLSLLARGRLYLGQENSSQAHSDFTTACWNKDPAIKARAHIGLGDIFRRMSMRNWQAVEEYRMAISADPSCREAYYAIAETGFELRETSGYRLASEALARLICLDSDYRDAYDLWREKIRDLPPEDLR